MMHIQLDNETVLVLRPDGVSIYEFGQGLLEDERPDVHISSWDLPKVAAFFQIAAGEAIKHERV